MQALDWLSSTNGDVLITVHVKTRQFHESLEVTPERLVCTIREPPVKGKANKALLKFLRKKFNVSVTLEAGHTSIQKVFRLKNISQEAFLDLLGLKLK